MLLTTPTFNIEILPNALAALPEQIQDVTTRVPGRAGSDRAEFARYSVSADRSLCPAEVSTGSGNPIVCGCRRKLRSSAPCRATPMPGRPVIARAVAT